MTPAPLSPRHVRVKICGLTNDEDARAAIACGADALGFNLFAGSKRFVNLDAHAPWIRALPPLVLKVAVVVNLSLEEAIRVADHPAIDLIQFHGDEDPAYCAAFAQSGRSFIKALRLGHDADLESASGFSTPHLLVDAFVPGSFGGSGHGIDLELAKRFAARHPGLNLILAGGLKPENVGAAVGAVQPFAVDVASGVERDGDARRKCPVKMRAFIEAARRG